MTQYQGARLSSIRFHTSPQLTARDVYLLRHPHTIYGLGHWLRYRGGIYEVITEMQVRQEIQSVLESYGFNVTTSLVNSVLGLIRDHVYTEEAQFDKDPDSIVLNDCILDLNTFVTRAHSPQSYWTSKLPFSYDPNAQSMAWNRFIKQIPSEVRAFLQEFAGYSLTFLTLFEIALWLYGPPGGGKSTFIEGLMAAVGPSRYTTLSAANISNRFGLANLTGKSLAISAETPTSSPQYVHLLNSLISGEAIRVEQKYGPSYDLIPRVKLLWAMNTLPRITEANSGIFRRIQPVLIPAIPQAKRDPALKVEIRQSGQAIFNYSLGGLKRLRERPGFVIPRSVQQAAQDYREQNDFVGLFVTECCLKVSNHKQPSQALYDCYVEWSRNNGLKPVSSPEFKSELERLGFEYKRSNGSFFLCIKIK